MQLARGKVNIDVWADDHSSPPNVIAIECKHWATPATKNVVHAFRTVVGDSGANTGLIVSSRGFQDGAVEAAAHSNVRLTDWDDFQGIFVERWYRRYMAARLREEADPLVEYTEPISLASIRQGGWPVRRSAPAIQHTPRELLRPGLGLHPDVHGDPEQG